MANHNLPYRLLRVLCIFFATLILVSILASTFIPRVEASPEAVKWTKVSIPTEGEAGDWVLADGSDIRRLITAPDGTLYASCFGLTYTLYKSNNGGTGWVHTGVQDTIVDIAASPHDAGTVYYATTSAIYGSTNGGKTFVQQAASPGGAGTGNVEIISIDVAWLNGDIIVAGTRDTDSSEYGGVYTLNKADIIPAWVDTNIGNYDIYAVAFSSDYTYDRQLVAIITDETDTYFAAKVGNAGWSDTAGYGRLDRDNSGIPISVRVAAPATIVFPDDYSGDPASGSSSLFAAIDTGTGNGDVYKIDCSNAPSTPIVTDLNIGLVHGYGNIDIRCLAARGESPFTVLLAGAADCTRTFVSTDGGTNWTKNRKEPTGESVTGAFIVPDFTTTGLMYTATSGDGSAFSVSRDIGLTWNQVSLIDTSISTIVDLAPSPGYERDNTIFMLSFGDGHSLWRRDGGHTWERTLSSDLDTVDGMSLVSLPPEYGEECRTLFVAGDANGSPAVWQSTDDGQSYRIRFNCDPASGAGFSVDAWATVGENTILSCGYDGSHGMVYKSDNGGFTYSEGTPAGDQSLHSIAVSPVYEKDGTVLVGNTDGRVFWSDDNCISFKSLPGDDTASPIVGSVTVAFDSDFNSNRTVYVVGDDTDSGVYRFVIGTSTDWESIDGTMPADAILNGLTVIDDGTLYATNGDADGGMERCLNPTYALGPTFGTVTRGLEDGATLSGLWRSGNRLWSVDTANTRLMTFIDTLTPPVTQVSPDNGAAGIGSLIDHTVRNIILDWETMDGATGYEWQCDSDTDLTSVPDGFTGITSASSARLPSLDPAATYYWRVRASAPVTGPWSEKRSFTTSLDTEAITLKPESPAAGATSVPVRPIFQWTAVIGAEAYELLVSTDTDFSSPVIIRTDEYALPTNAWQCDVGLDYDTAYYWKVRAINDSTRSPWSASGVFTTESAPQDIESPLPPYPEDNISELTHSFTKASQPIQPSTAQIQPPPSTEPPPVSITLPVPDQSLSVPGWIIYMVGGLLFTIILALVIILTMVLKVRRF